MKGGLFITLEGGEGSGKTTQMDRLKQAVQAVGMDVVLTREPGGVPEAENIRKLLVEREGGAWNPVAECLLLFAARSMHVEKLIRPALAADKVVLCDRFTDSTRAYQGYGHHVDLETIETLNRLTLGDFKPAMTFILDLPVKDGLQRALDRTEQAGRGMPAARVEDRYEQLAVDFHERMRRGYLAIAAREPDRCTVINASQTVDRVSADILARLSERGVLPLTVGHGHV